MSKESAQAFRVRPERLLSNPDLDLMTGTRKSFRYSEERAGRFPERVKIGRSSKWLESEVEVWIRERVSVAREKA